jgi:crotonobetainyl-CoA:carnitine CoA-transferase CaiB-like acyl-CoA transferase
MEDRSPAQGPLTGVTVLELGSLIAGPFCGRLLADMGARVIKIEPPDRGDPLRQWGQVVTEEGSLWSFVQSRNKESVIADLRRPAGRELVRRLVPQVDLVIENFRAGRLEEWGLSPDELEALRPGLIMVRISGFGQTGPYRDRAGFGSTAESMGGLRFITGDPDRPPMRVGISLADSVAALYAAIGAVSALHRRDQTGEGEVVDVALHEAVFSLLESILPEYGATGEIRTRQGNLLNGAAPSNTYETRDRRWISIGANGDGIFRRFCAAMGRSELADDARFVDNQSRRANIEELEAIIREWAGGQDLDALWETLNAAGVPAAPVYDISEIVEDPQFRARDMIQAIEIPGLGSLLMPGLVPRFSNAPGAIRWPGPALGAQTREVLINDAGFTDAEAQALEQGRSLGSIGSPLS